MSKSAQLSSVIWLRTGPHFGLFCLQGAFFYPAQAPLILVPSGRTVSLPIPPPSLLLLNVSLANATSAEIADAEAQAARDMLTGPPLSFVLMGAPGSNCADTCSQLSPGAPYCDTDTLTSITTSDALVTLTSSQSSVTCRKYQSGCRWSGGPHLQVSSGACVYLDEDIVSACPAEFHNSTAAPTKPDVCFTELLEEHQPICVCTNDVSKQKNTLLPPNQTAGALRVRWSGWIGLLAMISMGIATASSLPRGVFAIIILLLAMMAVPSLVQAHNYIPGNGGQAHRASYSSVIIPCLSRVGHDPHVQVIPGQEFYSAWSNGHGGPPSQSTWYVMLKESDYEYLQADNYTDQLIDYMNRAPPSAHFGADRHWQKIHLRNANAHLYDASTDGINSGANAITNEWWVDPAGVPQTDPNWMDFSSVTSDAGAWWRWDGTSQPGTNLEPIQLQFKPEYVSTDFRVSYKSDLYPWILSVHNFSIPFDHEFYATKTSVARFKVPETVEAGNYILHYVWGGYRDCIDINVMSTPTPVSKVYGSGPSLGKTIVKHDHSEFVRVGEMRGSIHLIDKATRDASVCIQECISSCCCDGVQVVRRKNLAMSLRQFENLPLTRSFNLDPNQYPNCGADTEDQRLLDGCKSPGANAPQSYNDAREFTSWSRDRMTCPSSCKGCLVD